MRFGHAGLEYADSYCFDPHKWLLTGFDCDAFWVADAGELVEALTVLPEYLRNAATESGAVIDYRDWQVPLGRRFRALKLWFVLRWYGVEGLREHIRGGVALAAGFADRVRADERFELVADHPYALVCFRLRGPDGPNERLLAAVNATGRIYLTHTRVAGRHTLRLAVGAPQTTQAHVDEACNSSPTPRQPSPLHHLVDHEVVVPAPGVSGQQPHGQRESGPALVPGTDRLGGGGGLCGGGRGVGGEGRGEGPLAAVRRSTRTASVRAVIHPAANSR